MKTVVRGIQIVLGMVFVFSGFVKAVDPVGGGLKVGEYLSAFFPWAGTGEVLSLILGGGLCTVEFILGSCLLLGIYVPIACLGTLAFMVVMTPLTLYLALFNPVSDCGCFGDAIHLTNWQTLGKNVGLLVMVVIFFLRGKVEGYRLPWRKGQFPVMLVLAVGLVVFMERNYSRLPAIDFSVFKVGEDVRMLTLIPEDAARDEYGYTFIYSKGGEEKRFSLENAPMKDSSWTFVSTEATLIKEGYRPPVIGFVLYDEGGEEVTEAVLADTSQLYLVVMPSVERADDTYAETINILYEYAGSHSYAFYALTASPKDAIFKWREHTGGDYPFLTADATILRTLIRANPGVVLIHDGKIKGKWHPADLVEKVTFEAESVFLK
jgi:hypothetical protein